VSAASGVPTFRGPGGLWRSFRPEDLATPEAFARDPRLVWDWYEWRRQTIAGCRPNRAHQVLAAWAARLPACIVITQNVDGLHERAARDLARAHDSAASASSRPSEPVSAKSPPPVLRLHGSIWELACWSRCGGSPETWRDETVPLPDLPPRCPACGGLARPAVVWFGEPLDPDVLERADAATACDVFVTAGTSSMVYPAAGLVHRAKRRGAFTVEINPDATGATTAVDVALAGPAEQVFDELERRLTA
jgi:NAD-dependent deacetylase